MLFNDLLEICPDHLEIFIFVKAECPHGTECIRGKPRSLQRYMNAELQYARIEALDADEKRLKIWI